MDDADRGRNRLDPSMEGSARHGIAAPRGLARAPALRGGRFTRLFASLPPCDPGPRAIEALVERLDRAKHTATDGRDNSLIPAGFTYVGQFVDHDITFDPTSKLQRDNDSLALVNFRTPRFDLDSLYGSGPADQPFLYDWRCGAHPGVRLLIGHNAPGHGRARVDLPRNEQGRAIIADARNDENAIVAQLHLLFLQFHNKVVGCVHGNRPWLSCNELFDEARRIVTWHYQWIVVHDFLDHIVGPLLASEVRPDVAIEQKFVRVTSRRRFYRWRHEPTIPVEFSGAAYRFGHSMVRATYKLSAHVDPMPILPAPGHESEDHLGGFRWLLEALEIDWRDFFGAGRDVISMSIDHRLAAPLFALPPDGAVLARLNLERGLALGLPSGRDVALAMGRVPLDDEQLFLRSEHYPEDLWPTDDCPDERAAVLRAPPLWFYLLREGPAFKPGWQRLGPIGGRIVAEVLVGLLEGDPNSYLGRAPTWTPSDCSEILSLGAQNAGIRTMAELVEFTVPPRADAPDS